MFRMLIPTLILFISQPVLAGELQWRGFADIVAAQTTSQVFLNDLNNHKDELGLDPESRMGLNLIADLGEDFTFAAQILARGSNNGSYKLGADWVFITHKPNDTFSFRFGRQNNPAFLYSEQLDVGYTYLFVRLPAEVYSYYPVKSFNGLSVLYSVPVGEASFQTQIFGGAGDTNIISNSITIEGQGNRIRGVEFSLNSDQAKLRAAYVASNPKAVMNNVLTIDFKTMEVASLGGFINYGNLVFIAEASHIIATNSFMSSVNSYYATLGYQVLPRLIPYVTYSTARDIEGTLFNDDPIAPTTNQDSKFSYMAGLNYKANPAIVLKAEYMHTEEQFGDSSKDTSAETVSASMDVIF